MNIRVDRLTFLYSSPFAPVRLALSKVSFEIQQDNILAIVGATGSGKTTLIQHFNGLLQPTQGKVFVDSIDLSDSHSDMGLVRKKVGLVFQFPEIQLFEETVFDDVAFGPGNLGLSEERICERVRNSLILVGLEFERFRKLSPFRLSGGEKRRVAIAGVLAMEPQALVLDEPTVGLDKCASKKVEEILERYHLQGRTVIFVSHDMDLVARLAQRVVVLGKGRVLFDGPKEDLFQDESLLKRAGLVLPQVSRFLHVLKEKDIPVRTNIYSREEARKELDEVLRNKRS